SAWRPWIAVPSWSAIDCTICCGVCSAAANAGTAHAAPKSIAISNNKDRFNMHFSSCSAPCAGQKIQGLPDGGGALEAGAESGVLDFGPPLTRNLPIRFSMLIADCV